MFTPLISRGGGLLSPGGGLVRESSAVSAVYPTTLAEVGTFMGGYQTPDHAFRLDNVVSVSDFGTGAALGPTGSPTQTTVAALGDGVTMDVGTTDNMVSGDNTTMDVATGDFMSLLVMTWADYEAGSREFTSKGATDYHKLRSDADGALRGVIVSSGTAKVVTSSLTTYRDGEVFLVAYGRRSGVPFLVTDREATQTGASLATTLSDAAVPLKIGGGIAVSQGFTGYLYVGWNSTLTAAVTRADLQALKAAMGL